ncbi:NAD-dependent epimerase/dehydratase family protein [Actinacidiphila sp. ITFR-21]|uniref:NAD-dependent epimerase/dehydratase family protein n=1 Tax=Actinacidiphila sp. ITFR-21 TaxID=3075199 RepID=UPI00288A3A05|nr:NAD-dependent epimerase/dehydratase family protein [Streptomyces sp. ITFR-21]WNI16275.1 NAD-dependent epimerase/dehydratase family protein [Streptomyces sp. ITFR-21]
MSFHVIVGAGATGSVTARLLAEAGERVRLVSRRGDGPPHPQIERISADGNDTARLTELTEGATTLFNCAMPPYYRWPAEWPPLAAALLTAATRTGTDYVMLGNIYGYGEVDGPITEDLPLAPVSEKGRVRAAMWHDAQAAYAAGRVRVTEVRASDFLGAGATSLYAGMTAPMVLAGESAPYPGDLDAPHSWSHIGDVARTLVAAAGNDDSWGRAWHVPSVSDGSVREVSARLAAAAAAPAPRLRRMPPAELQELGRTRPGLAEVTEMLYLYDRPLYLDSSATEKSLDLQAAPLDTALSEMVTEWWATR